MVFFLFIVNVDWLIVNRGCMTLMSSEMPVIILLYVTKYTNAKCFPINFPYQHLS